MTGRKTIVAVLALALLGTLAGGALAQSVALPQEETFSVGNQSEALRVSAENVAANEDGNNVLDVEVYGIDTDGNETDSPVDTGEVDTTGSDVTADVYRYEDLNATEFPQYTVNVTGAGAEWLELEKIEAVSGGGGWVPSVGGLSQTEVIGGAALMVAIVGALLYGRDP